MNRKLTLFLISLTYSAIIYGQFNEPQQTGFTSRVYNPISVEVQNIGREISFLAQNDAWFPYQLELEFKSFSNLTPMMSSYKTVIYPGKTTLFRLTIVDEKYPHDYSYQMRYMIGDPRKKPDSLFAYTAPFSEGREVLMYSQTNSAVPAYYKNIFSLNIGDSILCMRKGVVTATPSSGLKYDRVHQGRSIEILHTDGTVATYQTNADQQVLVVPGQQVYPLEPLFICKNTDQLTLYVFQLRSNGSIKSIQFVFEPPLIWDAQNGKVKIAHDMQNVEKELTNKEKRQFAKNTLWVGSTK